MVAFMAQSMMEMIVRCLSNIAKLNYKKILPGLLAITGELNNKAGLHVEATKAMMLALKALLKAILQNQLIIQKRLHF